MRGHGRGNRRGRGQRWQDESYSPMASRLMEPALLILLLEQDLHGYSMLESLEELGIEIAHPSMVYRVLREMEAAGWITSREEREQTQGPPRRVYSLTADGHDVLRGWKIHLDKTQKLISQLVQRLESNPTE